MKRVENDICIIGDGLRRSSPTAGAVQMEERVVLFDSGQMSGDCLNSGCVL